MTIRVREAQVAPEAALELTEQLFDLAVEDLNAALAHIRAGQFETAKEGKRAVQDLTVLARLVLEERRNVDKLRKQAAGAVAGGGALDLGSARDEIGRRLACLRAARGD